MLPNPTGTIAGDGATLMALALTPTIACLLLQDAEAALSAARARLAAVEAGTRPDFWTAEMWAEHTAARRQAVVRCEAAVARRRAELAGLTVPVLRSAA